VGNKNDTDAGVDARIAAVAERQHGVVTTRQLEDAGLGRPSISKRVRSGRLHRLHQGVYAVGHAALSHQAEWIAAVLACGDHAVLSHVSAAALWGLLKPEDGPVDVTVPSTAGRARKRGIRLHRSRSLSRVSSLRAQSEQTRHAPLVTVRHRIPVTSVARTVDDLRRTAPPYLARRAQRQAELAKHALSARTPRLDTRSDLEDDFLAFLRRHRLPLPETKAKIGRHEVDFLWRSHSLVVETDFYGTHRGEISFEDDHQRDMDLRRNGLTVLRYTGAQLTSYPAEIAGELGEILSDAPAS
jgi:very-short-patch-repair endonuclease